MTLDLVVMSDNHVRLVHWRCLSTCRPIGPTCTWASSVPYGVS